MHRVAAAFLAALSLLVAISAVAGPHSPWPDRDERAAFQRNELERRAKWSDALKAPVTARTLLQDRYDVTYYRLSLDLRDVDGQWIYGDMTARFDVLDGPLDTILLDFRDEMQVDSIFVNGAPSTFFQEVTDLSVFVDSPIATGETAEVRVYYQGHPRQSGFYSFGWAWHDGIPVIWTLSEPNGGREWWPSKDRPDDKADSLDVFLRGPSWMVSTSNGLLADEETHEDGSRTFHWKHRYPITTYLVSVAATNFERIEDEYIPPDGPPMLLEHFVYPEHLEEATEDFSITAEAIDVLADLFGPYPFPLEKYGHSIFPWGGAMEHQTNTSYGANLIRGNHTYDWILIHELAHQWWGDMTSPADWREIWLNEGFASYSEALWFEYLDGFNGYRDYMVKVQSVTDPSGPIYDPEWIFDGNTVYNKGAWVVHMLRGVLGTELFYEVLDAYRSQTEYRSTTTAEFQAIAEEVSGRELDWFFQPWIYGVNRPHYEVSFLPTSDGRRPGVAIHLEQTQTEWDFFPMPVELEIELEGGGFVRDSLWNDPNHLDVELDLPAAVSGVTIDPDSWILKEVTTAPYGLNITTTDLGEGIEGIAYQIRLVGRGGSPPYAWSTVDELPQGIDLNPATGLLSGTAPDSGFYAFTVSLTDSAMEVDTQTYSWEVLGEDCGLCNTELEGTLSLRVGPNPAQTPIKLLPTAPAGESVSLDIYDVQGRRVRTLWNDILPSSSIQWDGRDDRGEDVSAGIYFVLMQAPSGDLTRRIVWLR